MNIPAPFASPQNATAQDLLAALAELLEQEYAALRRGDGSAVVSTASAKRQLIESLAAICPPGAAHGGTDTIWPAPLADLSRRCHALNRRNGEMLHLQQSMLTRAMRVLSGADPSPGLYGARGQTHPSSASRHIASV